MLNERVRAVMERLEREDAEERARGAPRELCARQITPTTGRLLLALVIGQPSCEVLELGGSRGYSTLWLAGGVRILGGRVVSLERDPAKCGAWRRNVAEAGLEEWAELIEGDAFETLATLDDVFDLVFLDAEREDYEELLRLGQTLLEPGGIVVADNVISTASGPLSAAELRAYSEACQADPTLVSVTVPLDRGLEVSVVLRDPL